MGGALRALTTRGRSFLAAGVAAALSALVLGEPDLMRVAVLLLVLPLIAAVVVARTRYRLSCTRSIDPARTPVGGTATVTLRLQNLSRIPTGIMLLEDQVPFVLGGRPRFVLDRLLARQVSTVSYPVRADARGRYRLGPLTVRITDPFGFVELGRAFSTTERFTVTPAVTPLPAVRIGGQWGGTGETSGRSVAAHGADDAATREYRHGDDLRKVHWRSTARTGELMVRREEQPWQASATVLLDVRAVAHRGEGPAASLEWAVAAAASVAVHLGRQGYRLRLVTDSGTDLDAGTLGADGVAIGTILDHLADIRPSRQRTVEAAVGAARRSAREGLLVAVLGALDEADVTLLDRLPTRGAGRVAVLLDTPGWAGAASGRGTAAGPRAADRLTAAGWQVLDARHGDRLDALWSQLARRADLVGAQNARSLTWGAGR